VSNANNPPRGVLSSRWANGNLVIYPGDHAGAAWFVDSTNGAATNGGTGWDDALDTIDGAVNKCTASADDIIYVAPYHTENLAADSAIDIDQAGVTVFGIRRGRNMPTLVATHVDGDCKLAAAGVTIQNLRFVGGIDATTGIVEVSAADCAVIDCEYRDSVGQATDVLVTTAAADRLLIDGWRHIGAPGDGGDTSICLVGADDAVIRNFAIYGNFDLGAIECRTTLSARIHISDGWIWTEGAEDLAIKDSITGSTAVIGPNVYMVLQDDAANITEAVTGTTFMIMDHGVHVVNAAAEKSIAINWTASVDEA